MTGGLQLWVSLPWAGPGAYYGADAAALARRLEAFGVAGVVQGDHLFLPGPPPDEPLARRGGRRGPCSAGGRGRCSGSPAGPPTTSTSLRRRTAAARTSSSGRS